MAVFDSVALSTQELELEHAKRKKEIAISKQGRRRRRRRNNKKFSNITDKC